MLVEIDKDSGFCFGVVNAIKSAEKELQEDNELYCLGDIVHNSQEVNRLQTEGLITINHEQLKHMKDKKVLLRAHGEPPGTYAIAQDNNISIIDATCPVVLQLQRKIKKQYNQADPEHSQIVIFGKPGHAEVNGLVGQTEGNAIVIEKKEEIERLDMNKDTYLFSQTTMSLVDFREVVEEFKQRLSPDVTFQYYDTICRQVAHRIDNIKQFSARHDLVLFVAGEKSSNGKVLFNEAHKANPNTHLVSSPAEIDFRWLEGVNSVGICGATSTPKWLMEEIAEKLSTIHNS